MIYCAWFCTRGGSLSRHMKKITPHSPAFFDLSSVGDSVNSLFFSTNVSVSVCHGCNGFLQAILTCPLVTTSHVLKQLYAHLSWCPRSCRSVSAYFCLSLGSTLANFFTSLRTKYQNSLTPFSTLLRSSSWVGPGPAGVGVGWGWGGEGKRQQLTTKHNKDTQLAWHLRHRYDLKQRIDDINIKAPPWELHLWGTL